MLKGFKILGGSQSNFGRLQNFWGGSQFFLLQFFPSDLYHLLISPTNHKIAYDFLNAFVETRNLRYCEVKSEHQTRLDKNHSQIPVPQSHILTLLHVWHKMVYGFLNAFSKTRNFRYWEAKLEHQARLDKNHFQTPVTQSHILTLSHVWHKMAYDFLNAFIETRNLRYWEAKSEH